MVKLRQTRYESPQDSMRKTQNVIFLHKFILNLQRLQQQWMQQSELENVKEIAKYQTKIAWIKNNLKNDDTPVHEIFASSSPKRDLILKWGEYLEKLASLGVYKKPLTTISTHITQELKDLGLHNSIEYVRKSLPFKYKDARYDTSKDDELRGKDSRQNSSEDFVKENRHYIERIEKTIAVLESAKEKLTQKHFMSLITKTEKEKRQQEEFLYRWDNAAVQLSDILDGREKVPFSKQAIFLYCASAGTMTAIYSEFIKHIRKFAKLTPKQAGKIIEGKVSTIALLYEPKNRLQALDCGFYGFPCDWCGSWRCKAIKKQENLLKLYCFACGEQSDVKTEKLPET